MYKELVREWSKDIEWVQVQRPCPKSEIVRAEKIILSQRDLNSDFLLIFGHKPCFHCNSTTGRFTSVT